MRRSRRALLVRALVAGLAVPSFAGAQPAPVTISVDATAPGRPLERVWAYYGYDEVNYTTTPDGEALLRTLASANTAPVHVRTHFLFNTGDGTPALKWGSTNVYTEDESGNPVFDYTLIDQIMDAKVGAGVLPLVELGFMPEALSTQPSPYQNTSTYVLDSGSFYPPRDYDKWAALVSAWAAHVKERYPNVQERFQWELWNEPDIGYWHGTFEEFARLYDYTEAALHAVLKDASLGAPAVANPERPFLRQFLEHCATGTNAVTGETGTRLDMVSFHAKGGVGRVNGNVQMDLGTQLRLHRSGFDVVASSAFADKPVVITEADPDGCAACPATPNGMNSYRLSPAYGAYEVAMMKRTLDLAEQRGIDLRGVLTWAFTFPGSDYFTGYRELATNGIHLPVLNAFKLLGSLGGERLPAVSTGAQPLDSIVESGVRAEPDVDALAAIDGERIQVLAWHYHDDLVDAEPVSVTVEVTVPAELGAHAAVTHTRVDGERGNAHAAWVAMGGPASPTAEQLATLKASMEPVVLERERSVAVTDGAVRLSFELPRFGVSLLTLTPGVAPAPPEREPGCSCRHRAPGPVSPPVLVVALVLAALGARRRRAASATSSRSPRAPARPSPSRRARP